jgi:hypothetical protein
VGNGRGYQWFVRTIPEGTEATGQYLNLLPVMRTTEGNYTPPLAAKFFPNGFGMYFFCMVPLQARFDQCQLSLLLIPKEFYRGSASSPVLEIQVEFDDRQYNRGDVSYPAQA